MFYPRVPLTLKQPAANTPDFREGAVQLLASEMFVVRSRASMAHLVARTLRIT